MYDLSKVIHPRWIVCATFATCVLSYAMNGLFFSNLGSSVWTKALLVSSSVVFETVKIISLSVALWCYFAKQIKFFLFSACVYMVLFSVSVLASISVLNINIRQNHSTALLNNERYQSLEAQISIEEQSIATLQKNAAIDSAHGYRERSNATIAKIQQQQQRLLKLYEQKDNLAVSNTSIPALQFFPKELLLLAIILLGGLLEFVSGYLLAIRLLQKLNRFATNATVIATATGSSIATSIATDTTTATGIATTQPIATNNATDTEFATGIATNLFAKANRINACNDTNIATATSSNIATGYATKIASATPIATVSSIATKTATGSKVAVRSNMLIDLAVLIKNKQLPPTTRAVREHCLCSSKESCQKLKNLVEMGFIRREGRGYAVI